jgi:hypothetical protein
MMALSQHEVVAGQRRVSGMCFLVHISILVLISAACKQSYHVSSPHQVDCPWLFYASGYSSPRREILGVYRPSLRMWNWRWVLLYPLCCSTGKGLDKGLLMCAMASRGRMMSMLMARHP